MEHPLELPRIELVPLTSPHTEWVLKWRNDPTVHGQFFASSGLSQDEHERFLDGLYTRTDRKEYVIVLLATGQPIGQIGLSRIDDRQGHVSVLIGEPPLRGKGFAREAMQQLLRIAFVELQLEVVRLELFADNLPAARLYASLGFLDRPIDAKSRYFLKNGVNREIREMELVADNWRQFNAP